MTLRLCCHCPQRSVGATIGCHEERLINIDRLLAINDVRKTRYEVALTFSVVGEEFWFCCSGRIPRLSLNQHSLYVGVVEKTPPPPLTGEQYEKMETKYPEGGHCQSVLRPQGVFNVPLYFK